MISPPPAAETPADRAKTLRVLVVEDDPVTRRTLEMTLRAWGLDVAVAVDGSAGWDAYQASFFPLLITDLSMPGVDGFELCRRIRTAEANSSLYTYIAMITGMEEALAQGMEAGADDFIHKPVRPAELEARLRAARRVIELKAALDRRVHDLEEALRRVKSLEGLLPICSYCKQIRDDSSGDEEAWQPVERYVSQHSGASFSHSICPTCLTTKALPEIEAAAEERAARAKQ